MLQGGQEFFSRNNSVDLWRLYAYYGDMMRIELLAQHGIHRPNDLVLKCGMQRQQAQQILYYGCGIGKKVALRIQAATGCPALDLMIAEVEPRKPQRQRPARQQSPVSDPFEAAVAAASQDHPS